MDALFDQLYQDYLTGREEVIRSVSVPEHLESGPIPLLSELITHTRRYLERLKDALVDQELSISDEIYIFKVLKPRLYRWLIYDTESANVKWGAKGLDEERLAAYNKDQIHYFDATLKRHGFFYQYYRSGSTELDHLYFVRGAIRDSVLFPVMPDTDPNFSAPGDYSFARFMATEMLLTDLTKPAIEVAEQSTRPLSKKGRALQYTGPLCNLIELIYGLYLTKQINAGQADIQEIVDVFEQVFEVRLTNFARTFVDFKRRKTVPVAKFLLEMQERITEKAEDELAFVPTGSLGKIRSTS